MKFSDPQKSFSECSPADVHPLITEFFDLKLLCFWPAAGRAGVQAPPPRAPPRPATFGAGPDAAVPGLLLPEPLAASGAGAPAAGSGLGGVRTPPPRPAAFGFAAAPPVRRGQRPPLLLAGPAALGAGAPAARNGDVSPTPPAPAGATGAEPVGAVLTGLGGLLPPPLPPPAPAGAIGADVHRGARVVAAVPLPQPPMPTPTPASDLQDLQNQIEEVSSLKDALLCISDVAQIVEILYRFLQQMQSWAANRRAGGAGGGSGTGKVGGG